MAFVNVIRRSMRMEEYTQLRFGWLKRYIYDEYHEVDDLTIIDARQVSDNEYEYDKRGYRPLKKGDVYFTPDGTVFFKARVKIPTSMKGKEIWLYMKTAAEIIVKVNNKYIGGFDPNRERILLNPYIDRDELVIEMEGYNRSKPDDERNIGTMHLRGCRQEFTGLYLVTLHNDILNLYYDLQLLLDIAGSEYFNEDYRSFLHKELNKALNYIDFESIKSHTDLLTGWLIMDRDKKQEMLEGVRRAASYIEEAIYSNDDYKGSGNVALVAHSHLDIAYYWRRIHTIHKNARTVLIQMRLMDRYPEFKYAHTQPYTYELLEKYYPDLFEELKEKIASGQFEPVGAMYVEPDCNIPSAESLIRQCLYGQHYYREKFGITVNNCWLPDVFGNSWILPQILKKSGVDFFVSNKMSTWNDTNRFPYNNFIWKGIDQSTVYACVPPTHFITWNMPSQIQENWEAFQDKEIGGQTLSMFGYGDGGSGVTEEMIELMSRFDRLSIMPKTQHVRASEFLESNLKGNNQLGVWDGELYLEMHRGTFTTKSKLKYENRYLEFLLRDHEIYSVIRRAVGEEVDAELLRTAYKKVLINQFHDILPGSHIQPVYEDAMEDYKEVRDILSKLKGESELYYNTLNFTRRTLTFVETKNGSVIRCGKRGEYIIPNIEPFKSKALDFVVEEDTSWLKEEGLRVETPYYIIKFREDGSMGSLYDKELDREWVDGEFHRLHIYHDLPGMYDAWDILPNYKEKEVEVKVVTPLHKTYNNGVFAAYETVLATDKSTWKMIVRIFSKDRGIEVEHQVDWQEEHKLAKMEFGIDVVSRELVCDTSAGYIKRETHRNTSWQQARYEVCTHKWWDISEAGGGIAVINNGKYGVGVDNNRISLSLLRATVRPDISSDRGYHEFCYKILPHKGNHIEAQINKLAYEYNIPLEMPMLPKQIPHKITNLLKDLVCETGGLFLQAMKISEDQQGIVIRMTEQDGRRGKLYLSQKVQEVNMLEDPFGERTAVIGYRPFEIISFKVDFDTVK